MLKSVLENNVNVLIDPDRGFGKGASDPLN